VDGIGTHIKATNLNRRSVIVTADDFWLVDEKGRAYGVDVKGLTSTR
jgi:hypothetical protein